MKIMTNIIKISIILLTLFLIFSCTENTELLLVRDSRFFEPPLRIKDTLKEHYIYSFHERYFVFGYNMNKPKFDSIIQKMVCFKLNENELLIRLDITFEDYGKYSKYQEGEVLSADFTKTIVSIVWDIEDPQSLKTEWGEKHDQKFIPFYCDFKPQYGKIMHKKE